VKFDSVSLIDKLRATLGRMEVALGTIIDAITWTDENGKINWSNATFDNLVALNRFQVLGANLIEILSLSKNGQTVPETLHPVSRALKHQLNGTDVYEFQRLDKSLILEISWAYVQINGGNSSAVIVLRDVTERQKSEEELRRHRENLRELVEERTAELIAANEQLKQAQVQLVQTEKMSSLGRLVAGIAHEINNPVNFIYGNLIYIHNYTQDLLNLIKTYQECYSNPHSKVVKQIQDIELDFLVEDLPKTLSSLQMGAERIREIVLSLRIFSRLDEAEVKKVDIHEGIESTLLILSHRFKASVNSAGIKVIKKYSDLPLVYCYAGQINQVFMNILSNAIDAVESNQSETEEYVGTITIYTELRNPKFVTITIADNGPGISENIISKLFDPFFTTKPVGQGTGLGLSISYQIIVEKHHGKLWCNSELGKGTEFIIEIPISQM
jgi:two-component system, NtrC family, sensor kinase